MEIFSLDYKFTGETELVTDEILDRLHKMDIKIFFNDLDGYNWIYDFTIDDVLFEGKEVMVQGKEDTILFNVSKDPFAKALERCNNSKQLVNRLTSIDNELKRIILEIDDIKSDIDSLDLSQIGTDDIVKASDNVYETIKNLNLFFA